MSLTGLILKTRFQLAIPSSTANSSTARASKREAEPGMVPAAKSKPQTSRTIRPGPNPLRRLSAASKQTRMRSKTAAAVRRADRKDKTAGKGRRQKSTLPTERPPNLLENAAQSNRNKASRKHRREPRSRSKPCQHPSPSGRPPAPPTAASTENSRRTEPALRTGECARRPGSSPVLCCRGRRSFPDLSWRRFQLARAGTRGFRLEHSNGAGLIQAFQAP